MNGLMVFMFLCFVSSVRSGSFSVRVSVRLRFSFGSFRFGFGSVPARSCSVSVRFVWFGSVRFRFGVGSFRFGFSSVDCGSFLFGFGSFQRTREKEENIHYGTLWISNCIDRKVKFIMWHYGFTYLFKKYWIRTYNNKNIYSMTLLCDFIYWWKVWSMHFDSHSDCRSIWYYCIYERVEFIIWHYGFDLLIERWNSL